MSRRCRLEVRTERFLCSFLIVFGAIPASEEAGIISLYAEGASFPHAVYERWAASYRAYRSSKKDVTLTYRSTTSSLGLNVILNKPANVNFIGSDNPLGTLYDKNHSNLLIFPTVAGAIVVAYNLPSCSLTSGQTLNLTKEHVVGIFNGTFKKWNHPSIQMVNDMCTLPNASIIVIARRASSGSTTVFTSALSAFDVHWKATKGTFSEGALTDTDIPLKWDADVVRYYGETNSDIASLVRSIFYSVSYLSLGDANDSNVSYAAVGNRYKQFVSPNTASLQAAMSYRDNNTTLTPNLIDPDVPGAYPIATYTYFVFYRRYYGDCTTVMEMLRFFTWLMTEDKSREDAESAHFSALSENMASRVVTEVLSSVTCKGENVLDMIHTDTEEFSEMPTWLIPVIVTVLVCLLLVAAMCTYILHQRLRMKPSIKEINWNIPIEDIVFFYDEKMQLTSVSGKSKILRQKSVRSFKSVDEISDGPELLLQILQWPGKWKGNKIGLRLLEVLDMRKMTKEMEHALLWMRDTVINTNLVRFYGLTELDGSRYVIGDYCSKGTILDILQNGKYNITEDFKMSVAVEIASGMNFLHLRGLVHGLLTSSCCMLDNKWTVKIADWEYCKLFATYATKMNPLLVFRTNSILTQEKDDALLKSFWTAPEILRSEFTLWPTQSSDVYSYAIVLHEVFTRDEPYIELANDMSPEQIIHAVVQNRLRPEPNSDIPMSIRQIMEMAWSDVPSSRPSFEQIKTLLRRNQRGRKTIMDSMMETMEDYTNQLEEELQANESSLHAVKSNLDTLMLDLVPSDYLPTLNRGEDMESRVYSNVGIVMADVQDLVSSVDSVHHSHVLSVLDNIRTTLKTIAAKYQAYYPVCQYHTTHVFLVGLDNQEPVTLSDRCASVARMALDILQVMTGLLQQTTQHLRISAHVGQVAAGGSSLACPQFFLRGDGLQVGRSLLTAACKDEVYISRCLYSQIEKTPEFQLAGRDAEWISCNVMTGLLQQTTQHLRISAHVGQVAAGGSSLACPQFFLRGDGLQVGRSLLTAACKDEVYISRCLYSQIEKTPEFQLAGRDAEWISCNGQDIECFVLTGRRPEFNPAPSTTSVDSGIGIESRDKCLTIKQPVEITKTYATNELQQKPMETRESGAKINESNRKLRFKERDKKLKTVLRHQIDVHNTEIYRNEMRANASSSAHKLRQSLKSTYDKSEIIVGQPGNAETHKNKQYQVEKIKKSDKEPDFDETNLASRRVEMFRCSGDADNLYVLAGSEDTSAKNGQNLNQAKCYTSHESTQASEAEKRKSGKDVTRMDQTTTFSDTDHARFTMHRSHSAEHPKKVKDNRGVARETTPHAPAELIEMQIPSINKNNFGSMLPGNLSKTRDSTKKSKKHSRNIKILPL